MNIKILKNQTNDFGLSIYLIRFLQIGWVCLTIFVIVLFIFGAYENQVLSSISGDQNRVFVDLGLSFTSLILYNVGLNFIILMIHILIAAIIYWRRHNEFMALFVATALVANGSVLPLSLLYQTASSQSLAMLLVNLIIYLGLTSSVALLYLFPNGRFVPRISWLLLMIWAFLVIFPVFEQDSTLNLSNWPRILQILIKENMR